MNIAPVSEQFGQLTVQTWTDHEGISINVFTAGHRNSGLSATYLHDDREAAVVWYRTVRDAALDGQPVWLIEASVSALIDAAQATGADAELIAAINATMDAADSRKVESTRLNADVQAITADADPNWRSNLRREVVQAAKQTNTPADFTRTRVHCKPPTRAMLDLIRQHRNGVVKPRPGQTWQVLKGLQARIGGERINRPGTRIIAELRYEPAFLDGLLAQYDATFEQGQVAA
jgi:hypothetical protein